MDLDQDLEQELVEKILSYQNDPYGFVMYAFPWGEPDTPLQDFDGPDEWQAEILCAVRDGLITVNEAILIAIASGHGIGKAQPNNLIIDTPLGKRKWGDLKVGEYVFGRNGKPTKIIAIHPQGIKKIYRVKFDDRTSTLCCSDHVWTLYGRQQRRKKLNSFVELTTKEIIEKGVLRPNGKTTAKQWSLPDILPVQYSKKKIYIHPYLMGYWIGNGAANQSRVTTNDREVIDHILALGFNCTEGKKQGTKAIALYLRGLKKDFSKYDVFTKNSHQRYIPLDYLENTIDVREELLRGLLDSDSEATQKGSIVYCTTSEQLINDVVWLVRSLGGKASIQPTVKRGRYKSPKGDLIECKKYWQATINMPNKFQCFYVSRKQERIRSTQKRYLARWIKSIEEVGEENCQCITVQAKDGLYLTNDFIVTHNSALVSMIILWAISTMVDTKGVVTANTDTQLKTKTWPELGKWFEMLICKHWFKFTATSIHVSDPSPEAQKKWRIDAIPWSEHNTEAFAGLHNKGKRILLIFDEASAIHDKIWEVAEGALTDEDTQIIWACFGNPTRATGRFYECFHRYLHRWKTRQIDSRTVKMTNKAQLKKFVDDYGEDSDFVRVRVRGLFPAVSDRQFISTKLVEQARGRKIEFDKHNFAATIIALDPAWTGTDNLAIVLRQGLTSKILLVIPKNDDDVLIAGMLASFEDEYNADAVFIDLGYGTGIYSVGKSLNRNWLLVSFGSASTKLGYVNKRAEMWGDMKDWLKEGGCIEDNQQLCDELTAPEYMIKLDGKIQLESKEDMKKRGVPSPNIADALALTFAMPVQKKNVYQKREFSNTKEYNPYG